MDRQTLRDWVHLAVPGNLTLLPLPPYAPELNPIENVWDYPRGNKPGKRVWGSYEAIVAACKDAWLFLIGDPDRIDFHRPSVLGMGMGMGQSLSRLV